MTHATDDAEVRGVGVVATLEVAGELGEVGPELVLQVRLLRGQR